MPVGDLLNWREISITLTDPSWPTQRSACRTEEGSNVVVISQLQLHLSRTDLARSSKKGHTRAAGSNIVSVLQYRIPVTGAVERFLSMLLMRSNCSSSGRLAGRPSIIE